MSFQCYICGKKPKSGSSITHSRRAIKRRFKPNLQKINILLNGIKKRVYVCSSCIVSGKAIKP